MDSCKFLPGVVLVAWAAFGCGGASGGKGVSVSQTIKVGQATVSFSGSARPFVSLGTGNVTVTGMSGASYGTIAITPTQSLVNSQILLSDNGTITMVSLDGMVTSLPTPTGVYGVFGTFTHDGHIVYLGVSPVGGQQLNLYEANYDGSNAHELFATDLYPFSTFAVSSNDQKVAWVDTSANLWVSNLNGTGATKLLTGGTVPSFSPDGNTVAFQEKTGSYFQIYTVPATGGTPVLLPGQSSTANDEFPQWLLDDECVSFTQDNGASDSIQYLEYPSGGLFALLSPPTGETAQIMAAPAPDGQTVVYLDGVYGQDGDGVPVTSTFTGSNVQSLPVPTGSYAYPQWSPYFGPQTFVGNGGTLFTSSAAGFLWGQNGDGFSSFLAFQAANPGSATITPVGQAGGSPLIFDIHASQLTGLKYLNNFYGGVNSVSFANGTTDALVSFDSETGLVQAIASFLAKPEGTRALQEGSDLRFAGGFSAVYDAKGRSLAPSGASRMTLDSKTGKVVGLADLSGRPIAAPAEAGPAAVPASVMAVAKRLLSPPR